MNALQRLITHRKVNSLYEKLVAELGQTKPNLILYKDFAPWDSYYVRYPSKNYSEIHTTSRKHPWNNAILSHEVAHDNGLYKGLLDKKSGVLSAWIERIARSPLANTGLQLGGLSGLSGLAQLLHLAEEGQANVRGARALKKIQGKLTSTDKTVYGTSIGSHLLESIITGLAIPKGVQKGIDLVSPGFAEDHKVLLDYLY